MDTVTLEEAKQKLAELVSMARPVALPATSPPDDKGHASATPVIQRSGNKDATASTPVRSRSYP